MRVLQGILLSIWLHFMLVVLLNVGALYIPRLFPPKPPQTITVEILDSQNETDSKKEKQVVREALTPEKLKVKESEDPLTFLSAQTQRVKQQTQAILKGMTKNRANNTSTPEEASTEQKTASKHKLPKTGTMDVFTPEYKKTPSLPKQAIMDPGLSTVGEALPQDVSIGSFTALNTDRYLFYSFYSRIEELIRFRWESAIRESIDRTPATSFKYNPSGEWNTHLEIWLKPTGEFHSAHLMKESGFRAFDQSAIQAFIQAKLFPNPPKEMVESDGLIHLKYSFRVNYEPKVVVRSRE